MVRSLSRLAGSRLMLSVNPFALWNQMVYYRDHKSPSLDYIWSLLYTVTGITYNIVISYWLDSWVSIADGNIIALRKQSPDRLWSQPRLHNSWYRVFLSGVMRPERQAKCSFQPITDFKYMWIFYS